MVRAYYNMYRGRIVVGAVRLTTSAFLLSCMSEMVKLKFSVGLSCGIC